MAGIKIVAESNRSYRESYRQIFWWNRKIATAKSIIVMAKIATAKLLLPKRQKVTARFYGGIDFALLRNFLILMPGMIY